MNKKRSIGVLAFLVLGLLATGSSEPAAAQTAPKIPVRAAYIPAVTWLCAWVAQDQGFFDQQGLAVHFIEVQNISLIPGIMGKQLDIGPATVVDLVRAASGGVNVVAVAGENIDVAGETTNTVIVRKGSGIKSIKDLAGKTVGTPTLGAILHVGLLYWMKKEGADPNSIRAVEVPFPNMGDQMAAGRLDAAEVVQPFADRMIAAGNISLGDQLLQVASPARSTLWIADRDWAKANGPTIAKWAAGIQQAKEFIEKNPAAARDVLAKYTKLPAAVVQALPLPHYEVALTPAEIQVWINALDSLGQLQRKVNAADLLMAQK